MNIFSRTEKSQTITSKSTDPEFGEIRLIPTRNSRSIRIYVRPFEGLVVKFPGGIPQKKVKHFIDNKREWIRQALERARITEQKSIEHFSSQAAPSASEIRKSLTVRLNELAGIHGFTYNKVSLRNQKSRWGSCSGQNNISLNQKLYFLPEPLRDYVLVHELAHTLEKNHSPAFWEILFKIFGKIQTNAMRKELKAFDYLFYPPSTPS
ncbi:MAG: M48 family metallopeptidase [Chloroflexi bacterium]|jgi:predicted metal-dependent hydrolase|nr:M48 family metallopeptidase [Candidatus Neomarinimicrobiota bacterium]MBT4683501.1 M48 family metallopeptidase [Chloroflexota bacterium]MBT6358546.1 M48 family metallopeptidase [Chloroflexota bacterium]